jgi:hypothetical protein
LLLTLTLRMAARVPDAQPAGTRSDQNIANGNGTANEVRVCLAALPPVWQASHVQEFCLAWPQRLEEIMPNQKMSLSLIIIGVAVPGLAMLLAAISAMAQSNSGDYLFLIASGFLCDSGDSSACPAVVKSADGSSYEMSGVGTFNTKSKSVTATGTFTRKSPNGNSLETGIWMANELVSFESYGIAPGARMQVGSAFGPPQFGPRRMPMFSGSMPAGGLAVLHIRLLPMWGPSRNAVLQVNCALGKVPDEHQTEGIRLTFEEGGSEFNEEVSGHTLFVLTKPGVSVAPKAPAPAVDQNPAPPEAQP